MNDARNPASFEDAGFTAESVDLTDPFQQIASPLMRAAARRLAAAGGSALSFQNDLVAVASAIGEDPPRQLDPLQLRGHETPRLIEWLDELRVQLLQAWADGEAPGAPAEVLAALDGLERVRGGLRSWLEAETPTSPGMQLAVEIAHDLRSPLTSILFLSETLRRGQSGEINELQQRQLRLIYAAALGMVSLASNLIEMAQGDERLLEKTPAPFSVTEVLESVCDIVRPIAEEKKLALRVLPPTIDHRIGFASAISRVLLNLVSNALQNTNEGFVEIEVRPKGLNALEFSVRDTGPGLDAEAEQTLFHPFHRIRRGGRYGFSGSGLGLAICRRLLHAMNTELRYESAPGWGTRFFLDLELPPANL